MIKKQLFCLSLFSLFFFCGLSTAIAQTSVSGTVYDEENNTLPYANIIIKGTTEGVTSDLDGKFTLETDKQPPFTIVVAYVGMADKEMEVSSSTEGMKIALGAASMMETVVVGASRIPENIMQSPVTIEKLDAIAIRQGANTDYYDGLTKLKGVSSTSGSLTFTSLNTRGFATAANTRFVQLMDGMDNAAPLLNFPTGNIVGIGEMDINNVELVPGAASALYGPNAFNGILLMNSKNPFDYQGLSLQMKLGGTYSNATGEVEPLGSYSARYAKALNDKFAFKLNLSFLAAKDWRANDYTTDRNLYETQTRASFNGDAYNGTDAEANVGNPNFDAMNAYGDETQIVYPFTSPISGQVAEVLIQQCIAGGFPEVVCRPLVEGNIYRLGTLDLRRTGFNEEDLVDNNNAKSLKGDVALHYRPTPKTELSLNYRYGSGASVYQGSERYALRNFSQQFFKLEAKGESFLLRGYVSQTDDGDSYNLTALGATMNEIFSPSSGEWVPNYLGNYAGALIFGPILNDGTAPEDLSPEQRAAAHAVARAAADANVPAVGTGEYNTVLEQVRTGFFQKGGAGFIDNSRMYHAEGNYNFTKLLNNKVNVLVGGNYRMYDLYTEGTIFNEDPDGDGVFERIKIGEFGVFTQVSKTLIDDRLKLTGSIRYDKNENFEGQFSPRVSVVGTLGENREHNFRASYQTGFRNPDTQTQYIYFPTTNILLGGTRDNAERYGVYEGGSYTQESYNDFIGYQVATGMVDSSLLKEIYIDYIQPEQLTALELGYKAIINKKLFVDLNGYYNIYRNFISQLNVVNKEATEHRGNPIPAGSSFRLYSNTGTQITSWGVGLGMNYEFYKKFVIGGSYSFSDYATKEETDFDIGFNTPKHQFVVTLSNREVIKNFGFALSYKWQDEFFWENSFALGTIPSYGSLDAQVNYNIKKANAQIKAGASNIIGPDYQTNVGGPYVGRQFFISLTFNDLLKMEDK